MRSFNLIILFSISLLVSCRLDCIDKKIGIHKSCQTLKESKDKNVFQYELYSDRMTIKLNENDSFKINNAWIENTWMYECKNNKAIVKRDSAIQFVIDGQLSNKDSIPKILLTLNGRTSGSYLGGQLSFSISGQNDIKLVFWNENERKIIDSLRFKRMRIHKQ